MNAYTEADLGTILKNRTYHENFMNKEVVRKIADKVLVKMQSTVKVIIDVSRKCLLY